MDEHDLRTSASYVLQHGTTVEQARLRHLLYGDPPPADVIDQFSRSQRNDGGWAAAWSPDYSSVDATCFQLAQADQLGLGPETPFVVDGIRFLAERQALDGSWEEAADEAERAPFWAMPGDTAARLYLTANSGYWLGLSGLVPSGARDAADYLALSAEPDGQIPSFLHAHWLAAGLWQRLGHTAAASRTLSYLGGFLGDLSAGNLAWMLVTLLAVDVDVDVHAIARGLDRMVELRNADGSWPADEGAGNSPHVTVEALRALSLGGRLT